jgi:hypothetical protein
MTKKEAVTLITALLDYFPNHRMNDSNWEAWERALLPLEYTRLALNDVLQFAERWEKSFPPPIGTLKDIVRQSNMVERERREKLEPPATEEERSVALENIARIKKILEEAGEKMSVTKERALPTRKREKSEPIYWDQNQCPNPDCLDFHTAEDCPRKGKR